MYDYVDGSPQEAARAFCANEPSYVASAIEGITFLLSNYPDENARMTALRTLSWAYAPETGELDEFLRWTREVLTNRTPSESATG
jgi:hypothetical protein